MKYECPKCQSQLKSWEEHVFSEERLINKKTGFPNKAVKKTRAVPLDTYGLSCTNESCGFNYYANASKKEYRDFLDEIIRRL